VKKGGMKWLGVALSPGTPGAVTQSSSISYNTRSSYSKQLHLLEHQEQLLQTALYLRTQLPLLEHQEQFQTVSRPKTPGAVTSNSFIF